MELEKRLKACKEIFELILNEYGLDNDLTNKINKFIKKYNETDNESLWPFISTAFLMSQEFITSEKSYKFLKDSTIDIEEYFIDDDGYKNMIFLDKFSNDIEKFKIYLSVIAPEGLVLEDLFENGKVNDKKCDYFIKHCSVSIEEFEDFFISNKFILNGKKITNIKTDFKDILKQLFSTTYGYNSEFIKNDSEVDILKLIICIRNSLAHSNYEILDKDKIRLYSTEKNYNFEIDIKLLLVIIDEISEFHHEYAMWFIDNTDDLRYDRINYISNEKIVEIIKSFNIEDEIAKRLADEFINKHKNILNRRKFNECIEQIMEFVINKYNSSSYYGLIINNYLYSNKGKNIDGELYRKAPLYNYLLDEDYDSYDSKIYKTDRLKYYLLSLINAIYHSTFNTLETDNILEQTLPIDLSYINLDKDTIKMFELDYKKLKKDNKKALEDKIKNIDIKIEEQKEKVNRYNYDLKHTLNIKYKEKIPNLIKSVNNTLDILESEKEKLKSEMMILNNKKDFINYKVLKYIRHALSHGNIHFEGPFDFNDIGNNIIVFESYETNPAKKSDKSFYGSCKVSDLLNSIIAKENIDKLYEIDKCLVKTK